MSQAPPPEEATASPPPGRLRREGNDSLWKRARRTLGTNSLTFLQPQSRPSGTLFWIHSYCPLDRPYYLSAPYGVDHRIHHDVYDVSKKENMWNPLPSDGLSFGPPGILLIMLTLIHQDPRFLVLVLQRQVKGESRSVMRNGTFHHHDFNVGCFLILLEPRSLHPWRHDFMIGAYTHILLSTHRQRTQNYIKTLESEVVRLRESEMKLMEDKEKLQKQIDILKNNHIFSNLPLPPGFEDASTPLAQPPQQFSFDMPATVSYSADDLNHQRLHVDLQRQDPTPGLGYPTQTHPIAATYQGHQDQQAPPDLPNGWWFPYRMNFTS